MATKSELIHSKARMNKANDCFEFHKKTIFSQLKKDHIEKSEMNKLKEELNSNRTKILELRQRRLECNDIQSYIELETWLADNQTELDDNNENINRINDDISDKKQRLFSTDRKINAVAQKRSQVMRKLSNRKNDELNDSVYLRNSHNVTLTSGDLVESTSIQSEKPNE